jgi:hypothetical protein
MTSTSLRCKGNKNSFGGSNYRFNNLSIDGMATNDVLGFEPARARRPGGVGTPGRWRTQVHLSMPLVRWW